MIITYIIKYKYIIAFILALIIFWINKNVQKNRIIKTKSKLLMTTVLIPIIFLIIVYFYNNKNSNTESIYSEDGSSTINENGLSDQKMNMNFISNL